MSTEVALQQLEAVLGEPDADPAEVASLAGLLSRQHHALPAGAAVHRAAARAALCDVDVDSILQRLVETRDGTTPEATDALFALDELCAAASWAGAPDALAGPIDTAARLIRAFPEPWAGLSAAAADQLQQLAPSDPAWPLWRALESAGWAPAVVADPVGGALPVAVSIALGGRPTVPALSLRLAASAALPEEAEWVRLAQGEGWELSMTRDTTSEPCLLLIADQALPASAFERDGEAVEVVEVDRARSCAARSGSWRVSVGGQDFCFDIGAE
jgi:hypothetical protein